MEDNLEMEKRYLSHRLKVLGISKDSYSFDGPKETAYELKKVECGWQVSYFERGETSVSYEFQSLSSASNFMLGSLIDGYGLFLEGYDPALPYED